MFRFKAEDFKDWITHDNGGPDWAVVPEFAAKKANQLLEKYLETCETSSVSNINGDGEYDFYMFPKEKIEEGE